MKGRAFIDSLRDPLGLKSDFGCPETCDLLADAVEIADANSRLILQRECKTRDGWMVVPPMIGWLGDAAHYLDRRGLIERKSGEPHLIRFVEET